jgi:hypothetical protein
MSAPICRRSPDKRDRVIEFIQDTLLNFETLVEIELKIDYQEIQRLVEQGAFSEKMAYCGQQGFNFTRVVSLGLEKVKERSAQI